MPFDCCYSSEYAEDPYCSVICRQPRRKLHGAQLIAMRPSHKVMDDGDTPHIKVQWMAARGCCRLPPATHKRITSARAQLNLDAGGPELLIECIVSSAWASGRPYWMGLTVPWAAAMVQSGAFDVGKVRTMLVSMSKSELISDDAREIARQALSTVG